MEKEPPPGRNAWVLLDRHPRQLYAAAAGGRDLKFKFEFELNDPPLRSTLKIRRGVLPTGCQCHYTRVAAVEPTGRFVVCAMELESQAAAPEQHCRQVLFFCNGTNGTVRRLPAVTDVPALHLHHGNIGIVAAPDGQYLVAGLHADGADQAARLYCLRINDSDDEGWMQLPVNFPLDAHRPWRGTTVIAHHNKLLWAHVSTGILYCDPFAENPGLLHVPLPRASDLPGAAAQKRRCLQLSRGKIRFVVLEGNTTESAVVKSWTLSFDHIGLPEWKEGYELPLAQVHGHPSFKCDTLSDGMPDLEFIHPYQRNVVFLTVGRHLIEANLITAEVVMSEKWKYCKNQILDTVPLSLNQRPWEIIPSPVKIEATGSLPPGNKGFDLQTYGNIPQKITYIRFDQGLLKDFRINYAYVATVHPTGAMLICAGYQRLKLKKGRPTVINTFFIVEGTKLRRLPILSSDVCHHGSAGLCLDSSTGVLCAAVLQQQQLGHATVYYWTSSRDNKWERVKVDMPQDTMWNGDGVISEGSKLYWFDLSVSLALLFCNPFVRRDKLDLLPLPQGSVCSHTEMVCANMSSGLLRLAVLDSPVNTPSLKRWTLTTENLWCFDFQLDFSSVWNNSTSIATGLCKEEILFLLTHPWRPDVMYFMEKQKLIAITSAGEACGVEKFELPAPRATVSRCPLVQWRETSVKLLHLLPAP